MSNMDSIDLVSIQEDFFKEQPLFPYTIDFSIKTITIEINEIKPNGTYINTFSIPFLKNNHYQVLGIIGFSIISTSSLSVFRLRYKNKKIYLGLKNNSKEKILNKKIQIDLLVRYYI